MRSLLQKCLDNFAGKEITLALEIWYQQVRLLDYAQKAKGVFVVSHEQRLRNLHHGAQPGTTTWLRCEEELDAWRQNESLKRTAFAAWAIDIQGSLLYDLPSLAISGTRNFPPPASEGLWGAKTMKEWNTERLKEGLDTNEPTLNEWVEILY